MRADEVLHHLSKRHREDVFLTGVKNGPTQVANAQLRIMDALAIAKSWAKPLFTGYEVKVSRADFMRDDKWPMYLPLCHRFYFACPEGVITKADLSPECGLVVVTKDGGLKYAKKPLYRHVTIDAMMLYYIIMSKFESDRHPFFSSAREMLTEWVADKEHRVWLGHEVGYELYSRFHGIQFELTRAKASLERAESRLKEIRHELELAGVNMNDYMWGYHLKQRLASKLDPKLINDIQGMGRLVDAMRKRLGEIKKEEEQGAQVHDMQSGVLPDKTEGTP